MSIEVMKQMVEALMPYRSTITREYTAVDAAIDAGRQAIAEAEKQEPVDKKGSPCPEFWEWLPKAYNFDGDGNFTKYNMEVAFLAGKQSVISNDTSPPQRQWVGLTDEEVVNLKMLGRDLEFVSMTALRRFARDIQQTLKEKNT